MRLYHPNHRLFPAVYFGWKDANQHLVDGFQSLISEWQGIALHILEEQGEPHLKWDHKCDVQKSQGHQPVIHQPREEEDHWENG